MPVPLPFEPEFEQVYGELRTALDVVAIPERIIQFRVIWENDLGEVQLNRGYRVQCNSALGPYKGGTRFHPTVNVSILKFLAFEMVFKNALTGLNLGGAKGGADFDPKGKSDNEIRRFCVAYMRELSKHIGASIDVPSGDVGVTRREIGWLFGAYKAETRLWEGCITGKGPDFGGTLLKLEATGNGLLYYVNHMIQYATGGKETIAGMKVAISGSGNVAQYAALKAIEYGATVLCLSDSGCTIVATDDDGIREEDMSLIRALKAERKQLRELMENKEYKERFSFLEGERPWKHVGKVDVVLPCATHNEISEDEAESLLSVGCKYVAEGSNMGCSSKAIELFEKYRTSGNVWFAPGKAANLGGSAVSGLEMAQNSQRVAWSGKQVEEKLKDIMKSCFDEGIKTAMMYTTVSEGELPSLLVGSNVAGFRKVALAMHAQGDWW